MTTTPRAPSLRDILDAGVPLVQCRRLLSSGRLCGKTFPQRAPNQAYCPDCTTTPRHITALEFHAVLDGICNLPGVQEQKEFRSLQVVRASAVDVFKVTSVLRELHRDHLIGIRRHPKNAWYHVPNWTHFQFARTVARAAHLRSPTDARLQP